MFLEELDYELDGEAGEEEEEEDDRLSNWMWEGSLILEKKEPIEVFDALLN